jgi:ribosome-associated protein
MIKVTRGIEVDEKEIDLQFVRSSGPGGQKVNKTVSAVQLRFDVRRSPSLPHDVRRRLVDAAGGQITKDGILIIEAHRFRSQERNRQDAINRLVDLIREAARPPKIRRKTRPTRASQKRRLEEKRHRSKIKRLRRPVRRYDG